MPEALAALEDVLDAVQGARAHVFHRRLAHGLLFAVDFLILKALLEVSC